MKDALRLSIMLAFLSWAATAAANPPTLQGPTFLPGDGAHDEASGNQEEVAIAAGGSGFLTAWNDKRTAIDRVFFPLHVAHLFPILMRWGADITLLGEKK